MKLVAFDAGGSQSWGLLEGDQVLDVRQVWREAPIDIRTLLADDALPRIATMRSSASREDLAQATREVNSVRILPPIPNSGKIIGIGRNYADHVAEGTLKLPTWPKLFPKFPSTVVGPGDPVVRPTMTSQLDFEVELGVVIGKPAEGVSEDVAMQYVAGYTVLNDVSARDIQFADEQITLGKNFQSFCPMGPAITTVDELPDPADISLRFRLNGRTMQDSSTRYLIFSIPYLVAFISYVMRLDPGDVISTGTPSGVGCFRKPPIWLEPGDVMESEVDGIGTLVNPIAAGSGQVPKAQHTLARADP